jgi:hypothetical protein
MVQDVPFALGHGRRIVSDLRRTIPLQLAPDKANPDDPARTLLDILPFVCREAWSAASGCNARRPSMLAGAHRATDYHPGLGCRAVGRGDEQALQRAWAAGVGSVGASAARGGTSPLPRLVAGPPSLLGLPPAHPPPAGLGMQARAAGHRRPTFDQRQPISAVALRELRRCLTEPVDSPLVRDDPDTARRSAPGASVQLRRPCRTVVGLAGLMPWTGCSAIAVVVFCRSGIHLDRSTATGNDSGNPVRSPRSLSAEHDGSR